MAALTVWRFDSPGGAEQAEAILLRMAREGDIGIDHEFIRSVQDKVTPGTSALFLLSDHAGMGRVKLEFAGMNPELIATDLSEEQEEWLREAFAG
jgi:uncharacterized membrane protein